MMELTDSYDDDKEYGSKDVNEEGAFRNFH